MEFNQWIDLFLTEYEKQTGLQFNHCAIDAVKETYFDNGYSYTEAVLNEIAEGNANKDWEETIKTL